MKKLLTDFGETMSPPVFLGSAGLILVFVVYGAAFSGHASQTFEAVQDFLVRSFGWFYVLSANALLIFAIWYCIRGRSISRSPCRWPTFTSAMRFRWRRARCCIR